MKILRNSSEAEMIHAFLRTELASDRFSEQLKMAMRTLSIDEQLLLSAGTRSPLTAAKQVRKGVTIYGQSTEGFLQAAKYIENGGRFQNMIFLTADLNSFVIVEGHHRMTAYALTPKHFDNIHCIVGKCSQSDLEAWA